MRFARAGYVDAQRRAGAVAARLAPLSWLGERSAPLGARAADARLCGGLPRGGNPRRVWSRGRVRDCGRYLLRGRRISFVAPRASTLVVAGSKERVGAADIGDNERAVRDGG